MERVLRALCGHTSGITNHGPLIRRYVDRSKYHDAHLAEEINNIEDLFYNNSSRVSAGLPRKKLYKCLHFITIFIVYE